ncbi:beta-galactoside alpha-2,6-sialyltransferase 2 [Moschus berezovskii]|uniref:beta-galactoside alpha-2,6-sialyltransferase 2 n=1 Tax=Moschus berezovskii TaxID=68408 RepID=UPI002443FC3F|nr:beta-galactoside alpha-2,6-sialyltransferase 2 [Moschus berezovskii]
MKPHLKQWRQGMLCGVFAWGLLFVVIFLYFTDSSPATPAPSSFSFLETRRLLPAQGRQRAIMGASEGLPEGADSRQGSPQGLPPGLLQTWARDGFEREQEFLSAQTGRTSPNSHDAVLRFNSAPTRGYEKDVGNKTTIRIINSQILTNPSYHFMDSALYKDVILVAWDPAPYSANLNLWYKKPDYNLFTPYVQHRQRNPNQPFYILHPKFIWQLWDVIQENTKEKIQPNPPSSGFIGILLMMNLCGEVHVYEYVPSVRQTDLCHYHEPYHDAACTLGAYHPLLYEKLLVQRLNVGAHGDLHRKGKVVLPGLQAVRCPPGA